VWIVWVLGLACRSKDCLSQTGLDRDACLNDAIHAANAPADVLKLAASIQDPLVRDAALLRWVVDHRTTIAPDDGRALCAAVSERGRDTCQRRVSTPHLSR
jgi:hypothetical protein